MTSERVQRRIDRLLDQAEEALETRAWGPAAEFCRAALALDPDNADALLDREDSFAVIKTEGSGETSRPRITREAPGGFAQ